MLISSTDCEDREYPYHVDFKSVPKIMSPGLGWHIFDGSELAKKMYGEHLPWLRENCGSADYVVRIDFNTQVYSVVTYKFLNITDAVLFRLTF